MQNNRDILLQGFESGAREIRDEAVKKVTESGSHDYSLKNLINYGEMDIVQFIKHQNDFYATNFMRQVDAQAYWVDQREVGYLSSAEINQGLCIGTDNVQQCVAVILDGNAKNTHERLVALAHVDIHTTYASLNEVLRKFDPKKTTVTLYGGRDQGTYKEVSQNNIEMVYNCLNAIGEKNNNQKQESYQGFQYVKSHLENNAKAAEIVYSPNKKTDQSGNLIYEKQTVYQDRYSMRGRNTFSVRLTQRRLMDKSINNDYKTLNKRNSTLREVRLREVENHQQFNNQYFNLDTQKKCIQHYVENYDKVLEELDNIRKNHGTTALSIHCNKIVIPFFESTFTALKAANLGVSEADVYNGKAVQVAQKYLTTSKHLKRDEKNELGGDYNFKEELMKVNNKQQKSIVSKLQNTHETVLSIPPTQNIGKPQGKIILISESDHMKEHESNVGNVIATIKSRSKEENEREVIFLERKEEGSNLGMKDVTLLAKIIKHNETNPVEIKLPEGIDKSAIYQDARLYNIAKENGIRVAGAEGKGLTHAKESPEYNTTREEYMANEIAKLANEGYNVTMPVGASHIPGLQSKLQKQGISVKVELGNHEGAVKPSVQEQSQNQPISSLSYTSQQQQKNENMTRQSAFGNQESKTSKKPSLDTILQQEQVLNFTGVLTTTKDVSLKTLGQGGSPATPTTGLTNQPKSKEIS